MIALRTILFIVAATCSTTFAQGNYSSEQKGVQQVIHTVFESFSSRSFTQMEQAVTKDVIILEHGEIWTLDSIKTYFAKPFPPDFKRINKLEFFQTEISGDMAFVSYHNTADMHANNRDRQIKWLESAVLVRQNKVWKLKMLHSTRK